MTMTPIRLQFEASLEHGQLDEPRTALPALLLGSGLSLLLWGLLVRLLWAFAA
jgi:hypothetical protein